MATQDEITAEFVKQIIVGLSPANFEFTVWIGDFGWDVYHFKAVNGKIGQIAIRLDAKFPAPNRPRFNGVIVGYVRAGRRTEHEIQTEMSQRGYLE